ncbi:HAD family hydrolase [Ciceribacter sp. L1K22]|uniref:HAD family hydrolase n=1 Tax=Ciceribacter sp. L1K22 TaxID=2820275 RepID=UPI001ABDB293|nr:HAD family hydrolase [Ciceribacter sp. L1K22]MBO3761942.1 HAD family hydrolase [Ciceribacter sp. L1K22]
MTIATSKTPLIIFDCDGVLVDSEPISLAVLVEALAEAGAPMDETRARELFLGRSLASMIATARDEYGLSIDDAFLSAMRLKLYDRFQEELQAIEGIADTLGALTTAGIDWCVASSSQPERIELSLTVTGILPRFAPRIFSASMVDHGKPAPDLFLFAARSMDRNPADCIVIEDSPAGIAAAKAAGMKVFAFLGGSHARDPAFGDAIKALHADAVFDAMGDLLHLVSKNMSRDGNKP